MNIRYGRRRSDGIYEFHDSEESLKASYSREDSDSGAEIFMLIGLVAGAVLTHWALSQLGLMDWPKWIRFVLVILGGGVSAYVLSRLANLVRLLAFVAFLFTALWLIGGLIWAAI